MGKVLLAGLREDEQRAVLRRVDFAQRGPNTLVEAEDLLRELGRVARAGLAVNNEELAYGLRSIAAPVRSQPGDVVAAINLAVHRTMVSLDALVAHLGPPLKRTAEAISLRLGHAPARA
jgi:IclR family pca regulon transcriptional regulator